MIPVTRKNVYVRNDVNSKGIVKETILKPALHSTFSSAKLKNLRDLLARVLFTMKSPGCSHGSKCSSQFHQSR